MNIKSHHPMPSFHGNHLLLIFQRWGNGKNGKGEPISSASSPFLLAKVICSQYVFTMKIRSKWPSCHSIKSTDCPPNTCCFYLVINIRGFMTSRFCKNKLQLLAFILKILLSIQFLMSSLKRRIQRSQSLCFIWLSSLVKRSFFHKSKSHTNNLNAEKCTVAF